jgi:hypothetical protein
MLPSFRVLKRECAHPEHMSRQCPNLFASRAFAIIIVRLLFSKMGNLDSLGHSFCQTLRTINLLYAEGVTGQSPGLAQPTLGKNLPTPQP